MPAVPNPLLQQYMKLTEFLGLTLGPDYEVALHDLTNKDRSIIAIANNHISGREIGAPLTNMALGSLLLTFPLTVSMHHLSMLNPFFSAKRIISSR